MIGPFFKVMFKAALFALALLFLPGIGLAGPSTYTCEISDYREIDGDTDNSLAEFAMESSVAIDRATGLVIHPTLGNSVYDKVELLSFGSSGWSFRAVAITEGFDGKGGPGAYYEVKEWEDGPKKPMVIVDGGVVFFGECE
ncbi:hypothetical protein [Boseongicola aestuarii]|uniref:Uncharacterized protein n=1 Tax=Boseongicola aestuarii TaxID=1470561 RepID=A0A238J4U0_9RHOB|nr:hypothetical protein [Boseongicola aestuarii]SMX25242.1 hypothetical protein BOA8489_03378 [Boseongicola aestuarii]